MRMQIVARVLLTVPILIGVAVSAVNAQNAPTRIRLVGPDWLIGSGALRCDVGQKWDLVIEARDANLQQVDPRQYPPQVSSSNEQAVPAAWDREWNVRILCEGNGAAEVRVQMADVSTCLPVLSGTSRNATPPACAVASAAQITPTTRSDGAVSPARDAAATPAPAAETPTLTVLPMATVAGSIPGLPAAVVDSIYQYVKFVGFELSDLTGQGIWVPNTISNWSDCLFAMEYNPQFVCPLLDSHLRYPVQTGVTFTLRAVLWNAAGMRIEHPNVADMPVNWSTENNYLGGSCAKLTPGARGAEVKVTIECTPSSTVGLGIRAQVLPPIIANLSRNKPPVPVARLMGVILRPGSL